MILERRAFTATGVFGSLLNDMGLWLFSTLEHAYEQLDEYVPKLGNGKYICVRGMHQLEGMKDPFETFEVTNVPGHTGILFHQGNYNRDSNGCILLGDGSTGNSVTNSRMAFNSFMNILKGIDSFTLTVR